MKLYQALKKSYNSLAYYIYRFTSKRVMVSLIDLFDTPTITKYHHIVSALRYVLVENYYGENDFGRDLYNAAGNWKNDADLQANLVRFDTLIKSIEINGYDTKSLIYVDIDGNCFNGTHRLALCAWFEVKQIPAYLIKRHLKVPTVQQMKLNYHLSDEGYAQLEAAYQRMYTRIHNK